MAIAIAALVIATGSAFADAASGAPGKPTPPTPVRGPIKADKDRDKVFDDLEARLARLGPSDRLSVIVTLSSEATPQRISALQGTVGTFAVSHRFSIIKGFAATVTKGQVTALARLREVVKVEENSVVRALNDDAQSSFGVNKAQLDAPGLDGNADGSPSTYSPDDLVAAVIDSGIYTGHLDLDEGKVLAFKDFVNGRTAPYDDDGHGTHVAATIAGDGDARSDRLYEGVAPGGALVGVKVLDAKGNGTMADVTAGIDWVVQNKDLYGIEAINLSLGASGCADGTDATAQAVNNAAATGLLVAVAAGNEGPGTCTIGTPGAAAGALTVGAMADMGANGFKQASFSSRGKTADGRIKPDVSAPGVKITSAQTNTTTGYVTWDGTSMATPFTAGVALLMRDANSTLGPQEIKNKIMATAVDWGRGGDNKTAGSTGSDIDYGAGRLDAYAALRAAGAPLNDPPPTPEHELRDGMLSAPGAVVDYRLEVTDVRFPIGATMIIPGISAAAATSPDFDLYLFDPAGARVAAAETTSRQESVGFQPTATGTYTLRVRSYSGAGAYFVDISAGLGADVTAPTVTSVSPAGGATGVASTTNVSATFSEPMDKNATEAAFSLVRASDGAPVAGALSWSANTMTFNPSADLDSGTQYTATVSAAAKDQAGNALESAKSWSFTTATPATAITAFPGSTAIQKGTLRSGSAASLTADDDDFYQVNSSTSTTRTTAWYGKFTGVSNALTSLEITYRGKNSRTCSQTVAVWRWTDSVWVKLDGRSVGTTEVELALTPSGTLGNYVSGTSGDGELRVRVLCKTTSGSFVAAGDLMKIAFAKP